MVCHFWLFFAISSCISDKSLSVRALLQQTVVKFLCQHCDQVIEGSPYRVLSVEGGVTLLDMIVCHSCGERAKALGLRTEKIGPMIIHAKRPGRLIHPRASVTGAGYE